MTTAPLIVVYDGRCGLCGRTMIWLRRMDVRRRLRFADFTTEWTELQRAAPSLDRDRCAEAMHLIDRRGRITTGFDAFRRLARAVPPLWPLLPLLHLPGIAPIGRRVYAYVAAHRSTTCTVPRPGERGADAPPGPFGSAGQ